MGLGPRKVTLVLKQYDRVVIAQTCDDVEDRGRRGYVLGVVTDETCGVYFEPQGPESGGLGQLAIFALADVIPTGGSVEREEPGQPLRVSAKGEVL